MTTVLDTRPPSRTAEQGARCEEHRTEGLFGIARLYPALRTLQGKRAAATPSAKPPYPLCVLTVHDDLREECC